MVGDRPSLAVTAVGVGLSIAGGLAIVLMLLGARIGDTLLYSFLLFVFAAVFVMAESSRYWEGVERRAAEIRLAESRAKIAQANLPAPLPDTEAEPEPLSEFAVPNSAGYIVVRYRALELLRRAIEVNGADSDCIPRWDSLGTSARWRQDTLALLPDGFMDMTYEGTFLRGQMLGELSLMIWDGKINLRPSLTHDPDGLQPYWNTWNDGTAAEAVG